MKTLEELLGSDLYNQVKEKLGDKQVFLHDKDQKVIIDDGKSWIPKHRLDEVLLENKTLKEQVAKSEKDLTALKKLADGNDELMSQIKTLQDENKKVKETYEKESTLLKKKLTLQEELLNAGVADPDARDLLLSKFNLDEIVIDSATNKIKDFDNLLKPIKEHKTLSALFGKTVIKGSEHRAGEPPFEGFLSREQVASMSQSEVDSNFEVIQKSMEHWDQNSK